MIFLLDTNAFSDLMRKHSKLDARLASLRPADRAVICPVVRGEIRYGIEQLPQSRRREDRAVNRYESAAHEGRMAEWQGKEIKYTVPGIPDFVLGKAFRSR